MTVEEINAMKHFDGDEKHKYASKAVGGTALGLAIGALGWNLLQGKGFNLFGGGSTTVAETGMQAEIVGVAMKGCSDKLELTRAIYEKEINDINRLNANREVINQEMFGLYKSQIDGDFNLYKSQRDQFDVLKAEIGDLKCQVAVNTAIRPYQDALIQCSIDKSFVEAVNYTDRKTCKAIYGEVVLPNHPIVTGYGSYNPCCNAVAVATPMATSK